MLNRVVAIKILRNDMEGDDDSRGRFMDEVRRHSQLEHPHIVPVYESFVEDNLACLVMRYINGQSLSYILDAAGKNLLPHERVRRFSSNVLSALNYAHQHGIIHRDVKPSNILVDAEDNAILIDFGIAVAVGDVRRTRVGSAVGTPLYMSPEQINRQRIDQRTDVYSFGCVLYEMVTGRPPFEAAPNDEDPEYSVHQQHLNARPIPPSRLNPKLSRAWESIILTALEKNPDDRIPGCGEFRRLLEQPDSAPLPEPSPEIPEVAKVPEAPETHKVRQGQEVNVNMLAIVWLIPLLMGIFTFMQIQSDRRFPNESFGTIMVSILVSYVAVLYAGSYKCGRTRFRRMRQRNGAHQDHGSADSRGSGCGALQTRGLSGSGGLASLNSDIWMVNHYAFHSVFIPHSFRRRLSCLVCARS